MDETVQAQVNQDKRTGAAEPRWTTGDPERDWTRFEGQFDRLDRSLVHGAAGVLAVDGLLFLVLANHGGVTATAVSGVYTALGVMMPLLGLVLSVILSRFQYGTLVYRRTLEQAWDRAYPEGGLRPYRQPGRAEGSVLWAPPALLAVFSGMVWFVVLAMHFLWYHAPALDMKDVELYRAFMNVASVCAGIVLFVTVLLVLSLLSDKMSDKAE